MKPLTPSQVHNVVHWLMAEAELLGSKTGRRYTMKPHSLRKFFRTRMAALGVQTDCIEYLMGHPISIYHDVQMIYNASGLCVKPKTRTGRMETLKEMIKAFSMT